MSVLDLLADLPELTARAAGPVAYGLAAAGLVAVGLERRPLAGVIGTWAAGFLAVHAALGLLTGSLLLWPIPVLLLLAGLGAGAVALQDAGPSSKPEDAAAPPPPVAAATPVEPSTHLWSVDGYREVTGRRAP